MNRTKIEWVKNPDGTQGYTLNPITGCLNGCEYCYARKLANGRLKQRYLANTNIAGDQSPYKENVLGHLNDPFYPRFWEDRLTIPDVRLPTMRNWSAITWAAIANSRRRGIFVCDMSDLFGIGIPDEWKKRVLTEIQRHENDRFYLLTKQPQNLIKFSPFPDNCWVGVTATDVEMFANAIYYLNRIKATVKYLSFEPLLGRLGIANLEYAFTKAGIGQVIIGAQTKPYKPPKLAWVEEIIFACVKANIPYFLKDNLGDIIPGHMGDDKLRQEMPEGR